MIFSHDLIFVFILYFFGAILSKTCCQKWRKRLEKRDKGGIGHIVAYRKMVQTFCTSWSWQICEVFIKFSFRPFPQKLSNQTSLQFFFFGYQPSFLDFPIIRLLRVQKETQYFMQYEKLEFFILRTGLTLALFFVCS